jgi:glutamate formiminotransferase
MIDLGTSISLAARARGGGYRIVNAEAAALVARFTVPRRPPVRR